MRDAPVLMEVTKPLISRQDALTRYPIGRIVRRCALPRERFSPLAQSGRSLTAVCQTLACRAYLSM
jgi:hypothetical protein